MGRATGGVGRCLRGTVSTGKSLGIPAFSQKFPSDRPTAFGQAQRLDIDPMNITTTATKSPVHGGLDVPVQRIDLSAASKVGLPRLEVLPRQRALLNRIAEGTLSPLTGPMGITDVETVLERGAIERGGEWWAWSIPIVLPVTGEEAEACQPGATVALHDPEGECFGHIKVHSCFAWEKERMLQAVYGTERTDHAGARAWLQDERDQLVGGDIVLVPEAVEAEHGKRRLTPQGARAWIEQNGWEASVVWSTDRALLRSQEYTLVAGAESVLRSGGPRLGTILQAGLHGVGEDGLPAELRAQTYEALLESGEFGQGDVEEELWSGHGQALAEQWTWLGLDMPRFYAGPAEAVLQAICAQNMGFTHTVVARQQNHACLDDHSPLWGDFDAQQVFENLGGALSIKTVPIGFAAYFEEIERVGLVAENQGRRAQRVTEAELRQQLREGQSPGESILRTTTAELLIEHYTERSPSA